MKLNARKHIGHIEHLSGFDQRHSHTHTHTLCIMQMQSTIADVFITYINYLNCGDGKRNFSNSVHTKPSFRLVSDSFDRNYLILEQHSDITFHMSGSNEHSSMSEWLEYMSCVFACIYLYMCMLRTKQKSLAQFYWSRRLVADLTIKKHLYLTSPHPFVVRQLFYLLGLLSVFDIIKIICSSLSCIYIIHQSNVFAVFNQRYAFHKFTYILGRTYPDTLYSNNNWRRIRSNYFLNWSECSSI